MGLGGYQYILYIYIYHRYLCVLMFMNFTLIDEFHAV